MDKRNSKSKSLTDKFELRIIELQKNKKRRNKEELIDWLLFFGEIRNLKG